MAVPDSPQRWWVPCAVEDQQERLDQLCAALIRARMVHGYLSSEAPLLTNLSVLENLWLSQAWRTGWTRRDCLRRLESVLAQHEACPDPDPELLGLRDCLSARPAELNPHRILCAAVLRAALGQPRVVVIDAAWPLWGGAMQVLMPATWVLVADEAQPSSTAVNWIKLPPEAVLQGLS